MAISVNLLKRAADNIRVLVASMVEKAKSGHPGGAMGGADFITVLYSEFLHFDPQDPFWFNRDRFFLDPGHMAPMLYAQLSFFNKFSMEDLQQLRQWGSPTPGHPERCVERGIENTSGPLGQGHVFAVGAAIAAKWMQHRFPEIHNPIIYTYISDGGIQEEISQGAGRLAGHLGLNNLIMFYDANDIQLSTRCSEVSSEDVKAKYIAWGWFVQEIDGNDVNQIRMALHQALEEPYRPSLIIGHTIMAKGCIDANGKSVENSCATHGQPISKAGADFEKTVQHLGGNPQHPFVIFDDVQKLYQNRICYLEDYCKYQRKQYETWKTDNPKKAIEYENYIKRTTAQIDWSAIQQKSNIATRNASATVLSYLAQHLPNMIVASADLSNSDKTDGFLKYTSNISKNDFSGQFLQMGVSELTMACICVGMSLHGGVIPACGTFFVFSDYMKPAVRLAALMQTPVIFIWTHDSFRVGEDGPTHQPIEQEAQIRLLEKMKNHSDQPALLVLRPADAQETTMAWQMAIENTKSPSALILSRQNIEDIPKHDYAMFQKGAYVVQKDDHPQVVLLASGSEVSTLIRVAQLLKQKNIQSQVVSVVSEGIFRQQSLQYQSEILLDNTPKFGLTAGLPITLESLVGSHGKIFGLETFGFSAPYNVLEEKLGFTPDCVANKIMQHIYNNEKTNSNGIQF